MIGIAKSIFRGGNVTESIPSYIQFATDGTVTQVGDYKIVTLSNTSAVQQITFTSVPSGQSVEVEVIAGGAGGASGRGAGSGINSGAGAAGGYNYSSFIPLEMPYSAFIGAMGLGATTQSAPGLPGADSYFNGVTKKGGGAGTANSDGGNVSASGGTSECGGGAGVNQTALSFNGGVGTVRSGGACTSDAGSGGAFMGGGGAGWTENGYTGLVGAAPKRGYGGNGITSVILGTKVCGGGGAAGCGFGTQISALGGDSGTSGGNGGSNGSPNGKNAVTYGSGGGGGWSPTSGTGWGTGGNGFQGVVLIKILSPA